MGVLRATAQSGALAACWIACGCAGPPPERPSADPAGRVRLAVVGRASAVSLAADPAPGSGGGPAVVGLAWAAATEAGTDVYAAVSTDGAVTFGPPVRVNTPKGTAKVNPETPPRVAVRRRRSGIDVAVSWMSTIDGTTLRLARSADGGRTYGESAAISRPGAPGNRGWHAMSSLDDAGRVAFVWLDHRDMAAPGDASVHEHPDRPEAHGTMDGAAMARRSQLFFADARPGETAVERAVARGVCYCCKTTIARGADGAVYAAWRHVYRGNLRDIAFAKATDGRTFGEPVRVSDDRWELNGCPEDGPSLAVDPDGTAHVAWSTATTGAGADPAKAIFHASSIDGVSFTPREAVPTLGSPDHPQLTRAVDGTLMLAWDELAGGERRLVLATRAPGAARFTRLSVAGDPNGRYPVVAALDQGWIVAWIEAAGAGVLAQRLGPER